MKTTHTPLCVRFGTALLLISLLSALCLLASPRAAQAQTGGHWQFTATPPTGQTLGNYFTYSSSPASTTTNPLPVTSTDQLSVNIATPSPLAVYGNNATPPNARGQNVTTSVSFSAQVQFSAQWIPNSVTNPAPPPQTLTLMETSNANYFYTNLNLGWFYDVFGSNGGTASDGLGDPCVAEGPGSPYWIQPGNDAGGYSSGSRFLQFPVLANGTVAPWVRTFSFSASDVSVTTTTQGAYSGIRGAVNYQLTQFPGQVLGYSTHCAPALKGSDANWTASAPRYFSGTGCEVDGLAVPLSGYVTHAQILVADTVVKEYYKSGTPGAPAASTEAVTVDNVQHTASNPVTLKALFDSTHFMDSTMIG